jgi:hypothetical protein
LGLAHLALGQINGRIGEIRSEERFLQESLENYHKAEDIFSARDEKGQHVEPARLAEVYEWLGLLHLLWGGGFLASLGGNPADIAARLDQAEPYFKEAVQRYDAEGRKWEQAIALERWARIYSDRGEYLETDRENKAKEYSFAREKLTQAEDIALEKAPEIELKPLGQGETRKAEGEPLHPEYRLALGKAERLRGRLAFDQARYAQGDEEKKDRLKEAARHFVLSCAYLQDFSEEAGELQNALNLLGERIRRLEYTDIVFFSESIEKAQKEYGLEEYKRLPDYVQLIASVGHIA